MKKIIFFSKNMQIGGMEKALLTLLNNLCLEYEITLVLEEKNGILLNNLNKNIIIKEYKISRNKKIILRKCINFSKRLIWKLFNYNRYDFSCCYATYSILCSRLALISSKNNSLYVHSDYYERFSGNRQRITAFFNNLKIRKFKTIIFVSNESKNKITKLYPKFEKKFLVINNLIDSEIIIKQSHEEIEDKYIFEKNKINFIYVGRIDNSSKNLNLMIESFYEALKKRKDIKLIIIGDGPDKKQIIKKINLLNLNPDIIIVGEKNNPYPYIKKSDCIILTSKYEGYPVIFLEAMTLNKSILTTINVSDNLINLSNNIISLKSDKVDISNKIVGFRKKKLNMKLNMIKLNEIKLQKIKAIINRVENNEIC